MTCRFLSYTFIGIFISLFCIFCLGWDQPIWLGFLVLLGRARNWSLHHLSWFAVSVKPLIFFDGFPVSAICQRWIAVRWALTLESRIYCYCAYCIYHCSLFRWPSDSKIELIEVTGTNFILVHIDLQFTKPQPRFGEPMWQNKWK